ncbi:hypothetical protein [Helicobacter sp. 23-1045]
MLSICSGVCDFALVKIFGRSQTISLVSRPKIFTNTKATPPLLRLLLRKANQSVKFSSLRDLPTPNRSNPKKQSESSPFRHCEKMRSIFVAIQKKVILCEALA